MAGVRRIRYNKDMLSKMEESIMELLQVQHVRKVYKDVYKRQAQYAWFFIAYTLLNGVFYTANNIAYSALTSLVTKNSNCLLYTSSRSRWSSGPRGMTRPA